MYTVQDLISGRFAVESCNHLLPIVTYWYMHIDTQVEQKASHDAVQQLIDDKVLTILHADRVQG